MAAAFMVLLWVQNEFTFDGFQPDANREYLVTWMDKNQKIIADGSPFPLTREAVQRIPGIEGITSYYPHGLAPQIIHINAQIQTVKNFIFADSKWFQFLHYDFLAGSGRDFGRRNGIILTASLAERHFGSGPAIGRAIRIDIISQLNYIQSRDEGYNRAQIFSNDLPSDHWFKQYGAGKEATLLQAFKTEILRQPGIEDATYTYGSMLDTVMSMAGIADWDGRDPNFNRPVYPLNVDTAFRNIFRLKLVSGR
jgi:hypothetical protein